MNYSRCRRSIYCETDEDGGFLNVPASPHAALLVPGLDAWLWVVALVPAEEFSSVGARDPVSRAVYARCAEQGEYSSVGVGECGWTSSNGLGRRRRA